MRFFIIALTLSLSCLSAHQSHSQSPSGDNALSSSQRNPFLYRTPPVMPPRAERSGYCCAKVYRNKSGKISTVKVPYCTEKLFRKPTLKALRKSQLDPNVSPLPEHPKYEVTIMTYALSDYAGKCIPDADGKMCDETFEFNHPYTYDNLCVAELIS